MNSSVDILVPDLPESIVDATVVSWHKKIGDTVHRDEVLVEIETDKVVLEIPSPTDGVLEELLEDEGANVIARQVIGRLHCSEVISDVNSNIITQATSDRSLIQDSLISKNINTVANQKTLSPSARRFVAEHNLNIKDIKKEGIGGHLNRQDIEKHISHNQSNSFVKEKGSVIKSEQLLDRNETRVPMTRLRKRVAERLLEAKNSTAMLTTFNEVNMRTVINLRKKYGEIFENLHKVRLGFMSFYIKAALEALKRFPELNAFIDGEDIVYHDYFDISIAVSTPRGLVTPVLKNIDLLSMSDIEKKIKELATSSRENKLKVEDLTGGNFTITNSGVFGSLLSTPIINPPQSAILGIHAIKDRPMAVAGEIVILPMMYLALSYDHRLIDGKESIKFLVTIKEILEDPFRLLLEV